ncbi:hypothetical protein ACVTT0_002106 [Vibrio cholerae]|uniref:hypothetical protein n=1 Tax=Vibrio TaxID=662 RepID=UPI0001BADE13|nr:MULTISPECIES: hypothetical protein [Vibrio]EEY36215.1 hypothetical protein VII_003758 [Vibrio mimicus MB451]
MGQPSAITMLRQMSLSDYWRKLDYVQRHGLPKRNQQYLLQMLNANVLNASGRYQNTFYADDFDLHKKAVEPPPETNQALISQILSDVATIRSE